MTYSERQVEMAIALAKLGIQEEKILIAIQADRQEEMKKYSLLVPESNKRCMSCRQFGQQ